VQRYEQFQHCRRASVETIAGLLDRSALTISSIQTCKRLLSTLQLRNNLCPPKTARNPTSNS